MNNRGYSIAEVLVAVLVVGIGLTAAATLVNSLLGQEQLNASSVGAANLQEQAVMLTRLGVPATNIRAILPETVGSSLTPPRDEYSLFFTNFTTNVSISMSGTLSNVVMDAVVLTMIYRGPTPEQDTAAYVTNAETILLPAIR